MAAAAPPSIAADAEMHCVLLCVCGLVLREKKKKSLPLLRPS